MSIAGALSHGLEARDTNGLNGYFGLSGLGCEGDEIDDDLIDMTREALIAEVKRLRQGIRAHRDSSGHELCWHHPALWGLLPEKTDPMPVVPEWPEFMRG